MSLALVHDRKGIQPQNLCTNYHSHDVLTVSSFLLSEKDVVGWCLTGCMDWESQWEHWITQVHLEG